jgi:hypothetical protein
LSLLSFFHQELVVTKMKMGTSSLMGFPFRPKSEGFAPGLKDANHGKERRVSSPSGGGMFELLQKPCAEAPVEANCVTCEVLKVRFSLTKFCILSRLSFYRHVAAHMRSSW